MSSVRLAPTKQLKGEVRKLRAMVKAGTMRPLPPFMWNRIRDVIKQAEARDRANSRHKRRRT